MSHPLIPYPLPENFTGPYPSNATTDTTGVAGDAPYPLANSTAVVGNDATPVDAPMELLPYANKTLGELVAEIVKDPDVLGPVIVDDSSTPSNSSSEDSGEGASSEDDNPSATVNPLQEAADQAEDGVTIPTDPVSVDPNALESIADALPWFMGPGPVVVSPSDEPPVVTGS
jgi:hypothetical protein